MSVWSFNSARRASAIVLPSRSVPSSPATRPRLEGCGNLRASWFETAQAPPHHEGVAGVLGVADHKAKGGRLLHFRKPRGVARHQVDLEIDLTARAPAA